MSYKNIWELIGGKDVVTVPIPHSDQVLVIKIPQTTGDTYLTANEQVIIRLSDYIEELLGEIAALKLKNQSLVDHYLGAQIDLCQGCGCALNEDDHKCYNPYCSEPEGFDRI